MKRIISSIIFYILIFLSFLIFFSVIWVNKTFGLINLDSLIFHLNVPLKGTESGMIYSYLKDPLLKSIILFIIVALIFRKKNYEYGIFIKLKFFKKEFNEFNLINFFSKFKILVSILLVLLSIGYMVNSFGVIDYIKSLSTYSNFVEEHYVEPENAKIEFSEKHNLIHIFVESLEYTYADYNNGGAMESNLIPNLINYANDNVSFRNDFGGGFFTSRATGWTIAGMVAQTAGIGFIVPGTGNDFGAYSKFLPGAYSIGDILNEQGYNQVLLIGSDGEFAGRNDYFLQHGNYEIKDYNYAKKNNWIDPGYYVWWGYEDSKLFEFAKRELDDLSSKDEPFNLTLLTTNTHHIGGYLEDSCEASFDEQFKNVILCSDKQIYEFVEWIKQQDFYDNTTIVITGDHLSMDPTFFNDIGGYRRSNYNVFINPSVEAVNKNNRVFSSLDIYPTVVASIGGSIEGDRLGLGTNLFSDKKTLYEEYGLDNVEAELGKNSLYFKNHIIYGK